MVRRAAKGRPATTRRAAAGRPRAAARGRGSSEVRDNRIHLRVEPQLTPVRLEDKMDVNAEIKVAVDASLTGLGVAGIILLGLGSLCVLVGSILLGLGYPSPWYASIDSASWGESRDLIERVILFFGSGVLLLLLGTSMFFYGRTVLGSGHLDRFNTELPIMAGGRRGAA